MNHATAPTSREIYGAPEWIAPPEMDGPGTGVGNGIGVGMRARARARAGPFNGLLRGDTNRLEQGVTGWNRLRIVKWWAKAAAAAPRRGGHPCRGAVSI